MASADPIVVPALNELRDQINILAPNRDKASDGARGNLAHSRTTSSHNGDRSGKPEWRDGDRLDEIRARDIDADLREPGLTMAMVVRWLVEGARRGWFWWIRYIIFDGVIYHKDTGYQARTYTGDNKHGEHAHVNTDYTQAADNVRGVNYRLEEIPVAITPGDWKRLEGLFEQVAKRVWEQQADINGDPKGKPYMASYGSILRHVPAEHGRTEQAVNAIRTKLSA